MSTTINSSEPYTNGKYLENNLSWHAEDSIWKAQQIYNILKKNKICPKSIAETGCGAGEILHQLSYNFKNTNFIGYEISPQAFKFCQKIKSKQISFINSQIPMDEVYYDCLLCIDVFEHVEDYIGFIKSLKKIANYKVFHIPIDISVLAVLRSTMMKNRLKIGHLHYFTAETAIATLKDNGFEILDYYFTKGFDILPSKTILSKISKHIRKVFFSISPKIMVKLMGGCSLIVLTQ